MRQIIDYFCRIQLDSDVRFKRAYCWRRKGPKQDVWRIMCTGACVLCPSPKIDRFVRKLHFSTSPIFLLVTFKHVNVLLPFLKHKLRKVRATI